MTMRLGVDLGGSKIEIVALGAGGRELLRRRLPTPREDYAETLAVIVGLVATAERDLGERGSVGVGIPGAQSRHGEQIKNANSTWLNGQPLRRDLELQLKRPVRLANDANCFVLSEATDGAGAGAEVGFGVILGTGVGGGIAVRGQVLTGANAIAGEWGHNPLADERQPPCYCGRRGCVETLLSGPGLCADHREATGRQLEPPGIVAGALAGDPHCQATLARYEQRLAKALAQVMNILDPDVIVLGGGLSNIARLYDNVPRLWGQHVFSDQVTTQLAKARFGDSSGVRGAAWLWPSE